MLCCLHSTFVWRGLVFPKCQGKLSLSIIPCDGTRLFQLNLSVLEHAVRGTALPRCVGAIYPADLLGKGVEAGCLYDYSCRTYPI